MRGIDWAIVGALLAGLVAGAVGTARYTRSVSAFLAANRCGGRYIIAMANAMAGTGVISLVYWFQLHYEVGFTGVWWSSLTEPALIVIALSGWVVYRFRQTRAMTLAQFFEMRYSRRFRIFAGLVAYLSGIINFGIYPAVSARFFIALCGLPPAWSAGGMAISTFATVMAVLLSIAILFTFLGGQVAVMVTDFLQGAFVNVVFLIVVVFLLSELRWDRISEVLLSMPADRTLTHPFEVSSAREFDIWYFVIAVVITSAGPVGDDQPGFHKLYRNNGNGTFTDVAAAAGVKTTATSQEDGWGASFGDYDLDGDLDLMVGGHAPNNEGNRLFRNNGDGTFTDVTAASGIVAGVPTMFCFSPRFFEHAAAELGVGRRRAAVSLLTVPARRACPLGGACGSGARL